MGELIIVGWDGIGDVDIGGGFYGMYFLRGGGGGERRLVRRVHFCMVSRFVELDL